MDSSIPLIVLTTHAMVCVRFLVFVLFCLLKIKSISGQHFDASAGFCHSRAAQFVTPVRTVRNKLHDSGMRSHNPLVGPVLIAQQHADQTQRMPELAGLLLAPCSLLHIFILCWD